MNHTSTQPKLVQLRQKTDRDLLCMIEREIERGLALADVAVSRRSPLYEQAQRAYATVASILLRIAGLEHTERRELERKLKELLAALEQLPARTGSAVYGWLGLRLTFRAAFTVGSILHPGLR